MKSFVSIEESDCPERLLKMLEKVRACTDFTAEQPPFFLTVYGQNNTYQNMEITDVSEDGKLSSLTEVSDVLTLLACNQNVIAIAYGLYALMVKANNPHSDSMSTLDKLYEMVKDGQVDSDDVKQVILVSYEDRRDIYLAASEISENKEMGDWIILHAETSQVLNENLPGLAGFFIRAENALSKIKETFGRV